MGGGKNPTSKAAPFSLPCHQGHFLAWEHTGRSEQHVCKCPGAASPRWTAPSSPGPADSHTHSTRPQHTTPSLLHKAAACHSPCWCCCQLHCDSPIGHITHYIITHTDLANANTVLCGRMTLGKKTGKYNKQRFSPRKYLETTIQGRDARTSLVNSNIAADLDWEKCLFRNAIYTWTKGLIS